MKKLLLYIFIGFYFSFNLVKAEEIKQKILVHGDSLSAAYGIQKEKGWVNLIKEKYLKKDHTLLNSSISGETTMGGLTRLDKLLEEFNPTIVILELGANDALQGLSLKNTKENITEMIRKSKAAQAEVILVGIQIPPNFGLEYTEQFKNLFSELAKQENTHLVPFLFEGFELKRDLFQEDGLHPKQEAQSIMAENVWKVLKNTLSQKP